MIPHNVDINVQIPKMLQSERKHHTSYEAKEINNEKFTNRDQMQYNTYDKIEERRLEEKQYKLRSQLNVANDEIERLERFLRGIQAEIADAEDQRRLYLSQFERSIELEKGEGKAQEYKHRSMIAKIQAEHLLEMESLQKQQNAALLKIQTDYEKSFESIEDWMENKLNHMTKEINEDIEWTRREVSNVQQKNTNIRKQMNSSGIIKSREGDEEVDNKIGSRKNSIYFGSPAKSYGSMNETYDKPVQSRYISRHSHEHAHSANASANSSSIGSPIKKKTKVDKNSNSNTNKSEFISFYSSPRKRSEEVQREEYDTYQYLKGTEGNEYTTRYSQYDHKTVREAIERITNEDERIGDEEIEDRLEKEKAEVEKMNQDLRAKGEYRYSQLIAHRERLQEAIDFIEEGERLHKKKVGEWKRKLREQEERQKVIISATEQKHHLESERLKKKLSDVTKKTGRIIEMVDEENRGRRNEINRKVVEQSGIRESIIRSPMKEFLRESEINTHRTVMMETGDIEIWTSDPYTQREVERLTAMLEFDENELTKERIRHENLEREVGRMKHELRLIKHRRLYG